VGLIKKLFSSKRTPDLYIVSYPKSGRTWLNFMLCHYLREKYLNKDEIIIDLTEVTKAAKLPLAKLTHDQAGMRFRIPYAELKFNRAMFKGKKIIFLGRNFKDTLVSAYHQATKRTQIFDGSIAEFIRDERFGARKIVAFYRMWLENKHMASGFLYVSYEEMHKDPTGVMRKALNFMGEKDVDENILANAVEQGSFGNMRKVEMSMAVKSSVLKPGDLSNADSFKTRKGGVGTHKEELAGDDILYIDQVAADFDVGAFSR